MIKYSFLVAIYNVSPYLPRCIGSLISQSFDQSEYEIILVNDGSTDNSGKICDDYSNKYANVKAIHQKNRGLLLARETGVRNAEGKYLIFIDGDDFVETNLLSIVDAQIDEYKPDFLMYSMYLDYGGHLKPSFVVERNTELLSKKQMLERFVGTDRYNCVCGKIIKRELLVDHIGEIYDRRINIAEDKIQTVYLLKYSERILLTKDTFYHYCIRQDSVIQNKEKQDIRDVIYAYDRVRDAIIDIFQDLDMAECEVDNYLKVYDKNATDTVMDHIYKFNRQEFYSENEKIGALSEIKQIEAHFMERAIVIRKKLKVHNKVRFKMITNGEYRKLIKLDRLLYRIQRALKSK